LNTTNRYKLIQPETELVLAYSNTNSQNSHYKFEKLNSILTEFILLQKTELETMFLKQISSGQLLILMLLSLKRCYSCISDVDVGLAQEMLFCHEKC